MLTRISPEYHYSATRIASRHPEFDQNEREPKAQCASGIPLLHAVVKDICIRIID